MLNKKFKLSKHLDEYDTSLSRQGYSILKTSLSDNDLTMIKQALNVKACVNPKFADAQLPFPVYGENDRKIYVPRYWGIAHFGEPKVNKLFTEDVGKDIDIPFNGTVRAEQEPIINAYMNAVKRKEGGIITLRCAGGKTVMSLYLISQVKKKTLVIVHKTFLMTQWVERIQQFLPTARVGYIQGQVIDIYDKDIVIAMLQSTSMKEYSKKVFDDFGFVIFDECHHLGAEVFSKALAKTACPYTLGLSATPHRKDGLSKVFIWHLGPFVYEGEKNIDKGVKVKIYYYINDDPSYSQEVTNSYTNKLICSKMLNNICFCRPRNNLISHLLPKLIEEGRHILILADRIEQLKYLNEKILAGEMGTAGYYLGGMKDSALKKSEKCNVMLATYNMVSEGFDCKTLDTLILASPRSDIEQSCGRILRLQSHERKRIPLIIDICDIFSIYASQVHKRLQHYEKEGYNINGYIVDDNAVQMKITKMDNYKNVKTSDGQYTIIKTRRMKKSEIEAENKQKEANNPIKKGICILD